MYICVYIDMHPCLDINVYIFVYVRMLRKHVYVLKACMYVCMHVSMCVHVCYANIYTCLEEDKGVP
jgi:hypothetical protein